MNLTTEEFAHFAHIAVVIAGFSMAAVLHTALVMTRLAHGVDDLRQWPRVIARIEPLLPIDALLILLTGAWLINLNGDEFSWSDGWVTVSLVGLILAEVAGAAVGPRSSALRRAIRAADAGPIAPDLRQRITDPWLWGVAHANTAVFLGIVFVMVIKPPATASAIVLVAAAAVGALTAVPFVRRQGTETPTPRTERHILPSMTRRSRSR